MSKSANKFDNNFSGYSSNYYNINVENNSYYKYKQPNPTRFRETSFRQIRSQSTPYDYTQRKKLNDLKANKKKVALNHFLHKLISTIVVLSIGFTILPQNFENITKQMFIATPHKTLKMDYNQLLFPATNIVANHWFMGEDLMLKTNIKSPEMTVMSEANRLIGLERKLKNLASTYPSVKPAIYVWDYDSNNFVDIDADKIFATASIIKLPVLVELFKTIERGEISLTDKMVLTDYYRASGSGGLQYKASNSAYSIDYLAKIMITDSDNSATNMLVSKLGSMTDINRAARDWGLEKTYLQTWLPDLGGTNRTTAREIGRILYNIDNPDFLSNDSREKMFDYMGHVHNNRLIGAGVPVGAKFLHKTGDIGTMLGDAGIVFAPNGKKYIVAIFAKRPHNSIKGKEFIVEASKIIYQSLIH
ncbi:MAG: serine hydrolase [Candidatus Gastranaerophilales bacterium]